MRNLSDLPIEDVRVMAHQIFKRIQKKVPTINLLFQNKITDEVIHSIIEFTIVVCQYREAHKDGHLFPPETH